MKQIKFIIGTIALFLGIYFGTNIFPYYFSGQELISQSNLSGEYDHEDTQGMFHGNRILSFFSPSWEIIPNILGSTSANKRIEVDLTNQRLYAFEDNNMVYNYPVSTGKWSPTPTGEFRIWIKLRYSKMEGGNKALNTYYYLPNVPYIMYYENAEIPSWRGFGIHGAYWHNNFGYPMSHGCVNMRIEDAEKIYFWANPALGKKPSIKVTPDNPGTKVIIYGTTPN